MFRRKGRSGSGIAGLAEALAEDGAKSKESQLQPSSGSKDESEGKRSAHIAPVLNPAGTKSSLSEGVVLLSRGSTVDLQAAERFRILKGQVTRQMLGIETSSSEVKSPSLILAVTSAVPNEGKSVVSVNLARVFGTDPRGKTLVVDFDMRKPTVHRFFNERQSPGLSDVLVAGKSIASVVRNVEPGLDLITAGSPVVDSTRAIEQPGTALLLQELEKHYQYIIIDCPPALFCSEPLTLSELATGALLVVRSWRTEKKLVKEAAAAIGKDNLLGVVLNECLDSVNQYGYYGYYGYDKAAMSRARELRQNGQSARKLKNRVHRLLPGRKKTDSM